MEKVLHLEYQVGSIGVYMPFGEKKLENSKNIHCHKKLEGHFIFVKNESLV